MTKQELQSYLWTQKNIAKLEQRIDELHSIATKQTTRMKNDADSIHGNGYNDRRGDILADLADLGKDLQEQLQDAYRLQLVIEKAIKKLPEREKYLIRAKYIEGKKWEHIAVDMGYSWKQIHRIHSKALRELDNKEDIL